MKRDDRSKPGSAYQSSPARPVFARAVEAALPRERFPAVGRRVLERARLQLSQAVGGALSNGLEALGERLPGGGLLAPMAVAAQGHAHRLREVVERDRALAAANLDQVAREAELPALPPAVPLPAALAPLPAPLAPLVASASAVAAPSPAPCDEPIRTRTMAKLLALQGHRQRALSIYDYLLAQGSADQGLRAEAERLRSAE